MLQTKRIIINSKDRDLKLSQSSSNFIINLNDSYQLQNVEAVAVESVTISNVVYNVNSSNNTIYWKEGNAQINNKSIPIGQYTLSEFMDELIIQLNSVGNPLFNVSQDVVTKKIVITHPSIPFTIYSYSTINHVLGLRNDIDTVSQVVGPDYIIHCDFLPDLGGSDILYVHSKTLSEWNSVTSSAGSTSIISYISFHDIPFGGTGTRFVNDNEIDKLNYSIPRNIASNIDIKIRDANGNIVDLQNSNVILVLKAYLAQY